MGSFCWVAEPLLLCRGSTDFPSIRYLLEAEIAKASIELARFKDTDIEDNEIRDSIGELRQWLDRCARSHNDLVCFYH